jgi:mannose-6-phosphate isomerase-like protein (cupin superfamily)
MAAWTTFYAQSEWSTGFIDDFAVGVLVGPDGPYVCQRVVVGLLLLGPHSNYPPHAHPAVEVYRVLSGGGEFQVGAQGGFRRRQPGSVVVHRSDELHAIRTGHPPLFALYVWVGDLAGRIWHGDDMTNPHAAVSYPLMAGETDESR